MSHQDRSHAIVGFIANLMPSYQPMRHEDGIGAQSLDDGTIILPVDGSEGDDDAGWVRIYWHGDASRSSEAIGDKVATVAIIRHLNLHFSGQDPKRLSAELEMLSAHYTFKTGGYLYLPYERESNDLNELVVKAVNFVGRDVVISLLKRTIGI